MALTITEAKAVNDVLRKALHLVVDDARALAAAELLAGKAHAVLGAGLTPVDVRADWRSL